MLVIRRRHIVNTEDSNLKIKRKDGSCSPTTSLCSSDALPLLTAAFAPSRSLFLAIEYKTLFVQHHKY